MRLFVVRAKTIVIAALVLAVCGVGVGAGNQIRETFRVGNREVPIYCVERQDNKIALTFNCAWNDEDIDRVLDTLDSYSVKATFFAVGTWAEKYPEAVKKIDSRGHEIGSHSYNHAHYAPMQKADILLDMDKGDAAIQKITGKAVTLFRAAYGEYTDTVVQACDETGRTYIQWSVDSLDYGDAATADIQARVLSKTKPGSIVLMHTGTKHTADALPAILENLTKQYTLCTVSELIYHENYSIDATGKQISAGKNQ